MALNYHPQVGQLVMCDFTEGFKSPEMVKKRPVIIISPVMKERNNLVSIVPLSTVVPRKVMPYHLLLPADSTPRIKLFQNKESWVKGDMLNTVCFDRLSLIKLGRCKTTGKRAYYKGSLSPELFEKVQLCVIHGVGLSNLIK